MRPAAQTARPSAGGGFCYRYYGTARYYRGHRYCAARAEGPEQPASTTTGGSATRR